MCFAPQRRALFRHLNFQKWSKRGVFCTFWLRNVLRATTACKFSSLIWPDGSAPVALASILFDPPEPQIIGKTQWIATFLPFRASPSCSSLLTLSLLLSSLLIFLFSLPLPCSAFHLSILSEVWLLNFLISTSTTSSTTATLIMMVTTWAGGDGRFLDIQPLRRAGGSCGGCGPGHFFQGMCWLAICRGRLKHFTLNIHVRLLLLSFTLRLSALYLGSAPHLCSELPECYGNLIQMKTDTVHSPQHCMTCEQVGSSTYLVTYHTRCNCCPRLPSLVSKGSAVAAAPALSKRRCTVQDAAEPGFLAEPSGGAQRGSPDLCGRLRDEAGYRGDRSPRSRRQSIEKRSLTGLSSCCEERNSSLQCLASKHL